MLSPYGSKRSAVTMVLVFTCLLAITSCGDNDSSHAPPASNTLTIGALLSLTGSWASLGHNSQATLELGVADVNTYLANVGSPRRVALQVEDTKLDPALALDKLKLLHGRGITVVVGPQSSAEVAAIKPFANSNDMVVISQGSTAHTLAIPNDSIFRLCPDDVQEAVAIAALMIHDGTNVVVPMTRQDSGNQGLQTSVKATLDATVLTELIYAADQQSFQEPVDTAGTVVGASIAQHGANAVAVYLTAFDEAVTLFKLAAANPALASVRWYGSDGVAGSAALVGDAAAAAFATRVGFPCPIFGLDPAARDKWGPLSALVQARTGLVPDAFALSTYDAVWLTTLAALQAGGVSDVLRFKRAFVQTASSYFGVTGSTELNDAGDRKSGAFVFQGICPLGVGYEWRSIGTFTPTGGPLGSITITGCSP